MKLTALGVWGGYPTRDAGTTSYLLQSESGFNMLLDCRFGGSSPISSALSIGSRWLGWNDVAYLWPWGK